MSICECINEFIVKPYSKFQVHLSVKLTRRSGTLSDHLRAQTLLFYATTAGYCRSYCKIGSILNLDNYSRVIVFRLKYSLDLIDISPPPEQRGRSVSVAPAISEGQQ